MNHNHGEQLRERFMAWQCLIRQYAMRRADGRPTEGMEPLAVLPGMVELGHIRTVIVQKTPEDSIALFQQIVRGSLDPRERQEKALRHLAAFYYQQPKRFEPRLFAQFRASSTGAAHLLEAGTCTLRFSQATQEFVLFCDVEKLAGNDQFATALTWHNALFSGALMPDSIRLAFAPQWSRCTAVPPVPTSTE